MSSLSIPYMPRLYWIIVTSKVPLLFSPPVHSGALLNTVSYFCVFKKGGKHNLNGWVSFGLFAGTRVSSNTVATTLGKTDSPRSHEVRAAPQLGPCESLPPSLELQLFLVLSLDLLPYVKSLFAQSDMVHPNTFPARSSAFSFLYLQALSVRLHGDIYSPKVRLS